MTVSPLPPLDAHAHIVADIDPRDLTDLDAVILAVTQEPREWDSIITRRDATTIWGLGCHPAVPQALDDFSVTRFVECLAQVAFVGEAGLDGRAKTSLEKQTTVLDAILEAVAAEPRPITLHSVGASTRVLDLVERHPQPGIILHWWRGTEAETARALDLGCWFSLNGAEARKPKVIDWLPRDRVLTETDYPHTRRSDRAADLPGKTETIERALEKSWELNSWEVRRQVWQNFRQLMTSTGQMRRLPRGVQRQMLVLGR